MSSFAEQEASEAAEERRNRSQKRQREFLELLAAGNFIPDPDDEGHDPTWQYVGSLEHNLQTIQSIAKEILNSD